MMFKNVQMILHLSLLILFLRTCLSAIHEVNQAIFLDPRTQSASIRCPLETTKSSDIQWYDVLNHRYELEKNRFYRINGSQPIDREFICSSLSDNASDRNEKYKIKIRTYGKQEVSLLF